MIHHTATASLAWLATAPYLHLYAPFFFGISEISSLVVSVLVIFDDKMGIKVRNGHQGEKHGGARRKRTRRGHVLSARGLEYVLIARRERGRGRGELIIHVARPHERQVLLILLLFFFSFFFLFFFLFFVKGMGGRYPNAMAVCGGTFALLFIVFRVIVWPIVGLHFWRDGLSQFGYFAPLEVAG